MTRADPLAVPSASPPPRNLNIANVLTVVRVALVPLVAWLLLLDGGADPVLRLLAFAAFVLAGITDRIDGELARRRNLVTDFGKVADPIADKLLLGTVLVGLSWLGEVPWWITVVILGRELGVTALRFWVIRHGVIPASSGGKLKTVLQLVALGMYLLPLRTWFDGAAEAVARGTAFAVLLAAVVVTVVTGADYVVRAVRLRRSARGGR
ncbi:CDP-diacylglycerol--glycerol-3-phosphate 3-phosphatidyltransferase [Quadrisphaera sp. DSM 44207]|uniref:CDP-diacylglycerol--glycerol-3-phosphate 3-phosphatidyltransferase n=1 Tax=Quadrisphaera sp. DSM 44207 TaxID=1881057 RepID=UPI00088624A1|nr:CDP-diacylglycerol--glycerol-3-phosphate 3-phosphatidyltransferase [Quadrisphaera sp. DSM 44207]SDQ33545.1 CDP-diacylglycerol--glycerol-3-phosphate 3-phosphatidyltransferase [Quadrisphaera sp. DSM 44207]